LIDKIIKASFQNVLTFKSWNVLLYDFEGPTYSQAYDMKVSRVYGINAILPWMEEAIQQPNM
jgi:hypothetical protein